MCGRFSLSAELSDILSLMEGLMLESAPAPRYNIAPTQPVSVILNRDGRKVTECRWGMIPFWAKEESIGAKMINARAETLVEKPVFKYPLSSRRCLILADGFYEWAFAGGKTRAKKPWFFKLKTGKPFAFAGLWENWKSPDGGTVKSCAIITTSANSLIRPIHTRMPVILEPADFDLWLRPERMAPESLLPLLDALPENLMEAYPVSRLVNNAAIDEPRLKEPLKSDSPKTETATLL